MLAILPTDHQPVFPVVTNLVFPTFCCFSRKEGGDFMWCFWLPAVASLVCAVSFRYHYTICSTCYDCADNPGSVGHDEGAGEGGRAVRGDPAVAQAPGADGVPGARRQLPQHGPAHLEENAQRDRA